VEIVEKAIEAQGTIDKDHHLILDESLPIEGPKRVRVIILLGEEEELGEASWLKAASSNEAFDFLKSPEEDIYTMADGKPFHGKGKGGTCALSLGRSFRRQTEARGVPDGAGRSASPCDPCLHQQQ
jgi:hypothetical protein